MVDQDDALELLAQSLGVLRQLIQRQQVLMARRHLRIVEGQPVLRSQIKRMRRCLKECNGLDRLVGVFGGVFKMVGPSERRGHGVHITALIAHYHGPLILPTGLPVYQELLLCGTAPFAEVAYTKWFGEMLRRRVEYSLLRRAALRHGSDAAGCQEGWNKGACRFHFGEMNAIGML